MGADSAEGIVALAITVNQAVAPSTLSFSIIRVARPGCLPNDIVQSCSKNCRRALPVDKGRCGAKTEFAISVTPCRVVPSYASDPVTPASSCNQGISSHSRTRVMASLINALSMLSFVSAISLARGSSKIGMMPSLQGCHTSRIKCIDGSRLGPPCPLRFPVSTVAAKSQLLC